jgi:hypothetical protein
VFALYVILLLLKVFHNPPVIPEWDEPHHLLMGYHFYNALISENSQNFAEHLTNSQQIYPPLYHILIAISYKLYGVTANAGIYTNIPFTFIMMAALYKLGSAIGNREAGLAAALLTPALPIFLVLQERAVIDYVSITVFIVMFWLLFKTEGFTSRWYSLYLGLCIFLGLLIKWPFLVPAIPFVYYATVSFISDKKNRKAIVNNIILVLLTAAPALIWYIFNLRYIKEILAFYWDPQGFPQQIWAFPRGFTLENILKYSFYIPSREVGVGIVTLIFFYWALFFPKKNSHTKYLVASVAVTYIILTFLTDKSEFYIAYAYPLLMLTTTVALFNIKSKPVKFLFTVLFIGAVVTHYILNQTGLNSWSKLTFRIPGSYVGIFPKYVTKFTSEKWPTEQIVQEQLTATNCSSGVLFFPDLRFLSYLTAQFYLATNRSYIEEIDAKRHYDPVNDKTINTDFLQKYDCIVTKSGNPGVFANANVLTFVTDYLTSNPNYRKEKYEAPDNSSVFVFIAKKSRPK